MCSKIENIFEILNCETYKLASQLGDFVHAQLEFELIKKGKRKFTSPLHELLDDLQELIE